MRFLLRCLLVVAFCVIFAAGFVYYVTRMDQPGGLNRSATAELRSIGETRAGESIPGRASEPPKPKYLFVAKPFEDSGYSTAVRFMPPIRDLGSLSELRDAIRGRGRRGIIAIRAQLDSLKATDSPTRSQIAEAVDLESSLGSLYMYEGRFEESSAAWERALAATKRDPDRFENIRADILATLGIVALRRGEKENCVECVGPSSCIFPLATQAVHLHQSGSREAVRRFTEYLKEWPGDLRVMWLLNLAYMTLGEYPDKVPAKYLIPLDTFQSESKVGRFENVASAAGLTARGPNLAGSSIFDDFNGDGLPDLFISSLDADDGASLFLNEGNGTFEDATARAGLSDQIDALNATRGDIDNDGDLDVLLVRGGWEKPARMTLLRNDGTGRFEDITIAAGLDAPIAGESAAWGDYDNDGRLDIFVCGEYVSPFKTDSNLPPDPRCRCRLYHNEGNGTFKDVAAVAGVTNERCAKGSSWGDYDDDGRLDLFVSNMRGPSRLYHNEGNGKFKDVAPELGIEGSAFSFACWFWDYDNDGRLDIYLNDFGAPLAEIVASMLHAKIPNPNRPRLYRNLGPQGFADVTAEVGLDRPMAPMGSNFGDIDNDGFLDFHLGTGLMAYSGLTPDLTYKNDAGNRFLDVTTSSGTGHLQKGHGVSFADYDNDGDLDLFVVLGGGAPGDKGYDSLFKNPGNDRHSLKVKLVGVKSNRLAIGARLQAEIADAEGNRRSIYRTIGNNSSFGGNSLVEFFGLLDAKTVKRLTVTWPTSQTTQVFQDIPADQTILVTEGLDGYQTWQSPHLKAASPKNP